MEPRPGLLPSRRVFLSADVSHLGGPAVWLVGSAGNSAAASLAADHRHHHRACAGRIDWAVDDAERTSARASDLGDLPRWLHLAAGKQPAVLRLPCRGP